MVKPSKIIFLKTTIPEKEDIILLYIGHHNIPNKALLNRGKVKLPNAVGGGCNYDSGGSKGGIRTGKEGLAVRNKATTLKQ